MGRYIGPKCKLARREGHDLSIKSPIRPLDSKCKFKKQPGEHGLAFRRISDYGLQLREKQKLKRIYGLLEKQFHALYVKSRTMKGNIGHNLFLLLESRLDNFVYRSGFASTRNEARQMVTHRLILVNGQRVNIPSYQLKPGDQVTLVDRAKKHVRVLMAIEIWKQLPSSSWVEVDHTNMTSTYVRYPDRDELDQNVSENLIIELYSK